MGAPCRATTGRPPSASGVRAEAARHARDSVRVLAEVMHDTTACRSDRVVAAQTILSYAVRKTQIVAATESAK
jgi:hypothetical protein